MTKDNSTVKIAIKLTDEQSEGYPISSESLWFDRYEAFYCLKNIPFFIDNLSYEDVVELIPSEDGYYEIKSIVKSSDNSTIWLSFYDEKASKQYLDKINMYGCGYEAGIFKNYYAVNIPSTVDIERIYNIIDDGEDKKVLIADYPSIRHE